MRLSKNPNCRIRTKNGLPHSHTGPSSFRVEAAALLRCSDKQLWRRIEHYVGQARTLERFDDVSVVAVDETSLRRSQSYITVVHDLVAKRLLFTTESRSNQTVLGFVADLKAQGSDGRGVKPSGLLLLERFDARQHLLLLRSLRLAIRNVVGDLPVAGEVDSPHYQRSPDLNQTALLRTRRSHFDQARVDGLGGFSKNLIVAHIRIRKVCTRKATQILPDVYGNPHCHAARGNFEVNPL